MTYAREDAFLHKWDKQNQSERQPCRRRNYRNRIEQRNRKSICGSVASTLKQNSLSTFKQKRIGSAQNEHAGAPGDVGRRHCGQEYNGSKESTPFADSLRIYLSSLATAGCCYLLKMEMMVRSLNCRKHLFPEAGNNRKVPCTVITRDRSKKSSNVLRLWQR